jgi:hypothetical protein
MDQYGRDAISGRPDSDNALLLRLRTPKERGAPK